MNQTIQIKLTPHQQALLLDGLSYLRNCALLEARFPSEETDRDRERQVRVIEELADQLGGSHPAKTATPV